ncbi:MAG: zeta toxin family protein [Herpetosiphonaceae bacterium]|nr:zeta toxin family protein [Herpetosiphonaceae bacterium]
MAAEKPQFVMLAGPSGSGKTTFLNNNRDTFPEHVVTPDAFMDQFSDLSKNEARQNAVVLANTQQADLIEQRQSFVQETLLADEAKIDLLREMQTRGYETRLVYMCLNNPKDNEDRVKHRIEEGGNFVPARLVEKDYHLSLQNLPQAVLVADKTQIFDNTAFGEQHAHVVSIDHGAVIEQAPELPQWVEKTFPNGIQAHLDAGSREREAQQLGGSRKKSIDLDR